MADLNSKEQIIKETKEYLNKQFQYMKLELLEKLSKLFGLLIMLLVVTVLLLTAFVYLSTALIQATKHWFDGSLIPGLLIIAGVFIIFVILIVFFKKRLFVNPIIRQASKILFKKKNIKTENNGGK